MNPWRVWVWWMLLLLANGPAWAGASNESWWTSGKNASILGRVFLDNDGDGKFGAGDEGLAGARLILDSGEEALTDASGRYHVFLLLGGYEINASHLIKLDPSSVPSGLSGTWRNFVELSPLDVRQADFPVRPGGQTQPDESQPIDLDLGSTLDADVSGQVAVWLTGRMPKECQVNIDGLPMMSEEGQKDRFRLRKNLLEAGTNPLLIGVHCATGRIDFLLLEIHWIRRDRGGDLLLPGKPSLVATCFGPGPGQIPRASTVLLECTGKTGTSLSIGEQHVQPKTEEATGAWRFHLRVFPGLNPIAVHLIARDGKPLRGSLIITVDEHAWTGALLGSLAFSFGQDSQGSNNVYLGGKLHGFLQAEVLGGLKLIVGGAGESFDAKGLSTNEVFRQLLEPHRNPWVHDRDPDPESSTMVSGDQGLVQTFNAASSQYFLAVQRKSSVAGWGSFSSQNAQDFEIGNFHRSLVGAFAVLHPLEDWFLGAKPVLDLALEGFYSPPNTNYASSSAMGIPATQGLRSTSAHEEFLATGGTLYFLHHRWVVEGSERVMVGRRDASTGLGMQQRKLRRGVDYQVDWLSGRILLTQPLDAGILGESAVRLQALGSTRTILSVDYEYLSAEESVSFSQISGGRVAPAVRLGETLSMEGAFSAVSAQRAFEPDYQLLKGEARLKLGEIASVWGAYARSDGLAGVPSYSVDGGLSFASALLPRRSAGEAYEAGAALLGEVFSGQVLFRRWLRGYADTSLLAVSDLTQVRADSQVDVGKKLQFTARFSGTQNLNRLLLDGALGARFQLLEKLGLQIEGAAQSDSKSWDQEAELAVSDAFAQDGKRVLAGLKLVYQPLSWLDVFAGHQQTIYSVGAGHAAQDLTLASLGGQVRVLERYQLGMEGGWGPSLGNLVRFSGRQDDEDGQSVFAHSTFSFDHDVLRNSALTTGQSAPAGAGALVSSSQILASELGQTAHGQQLSVELPLNPFWRMKIAYERSELSSAGSLSKRQDIYLNPFWDRGILGLSSPGRRNSLHVNLTYLTKRLLLSASGEFRVDEHLDRSYTEVIDPTVDVHRQTVFAVAGQWKASEGLLIGGRCAWAETLGIRANSSGPGIAEGGFYEASLGLSLRPTHVPWLTWMLRLSAGQDNRPQTDPARQFTAPKWLFASTALSFNPTPFFQPTLVLAPVWQSQRVDATKLFVETTDLLGMVRLGSILYKGLGLAGEMRTQLHAFSARQFPSNESEGFRVGAAAEIFYLLENDIGGVRMGIGYSFSGIPDPMLSDFLSGRKGFFLRLEGMM